MRDGYGVLFRVGDKDYHSARDLNLMMDKRQEIGEPEPELTLLEIPGRNGWLDQSEALTGRVTYKPRTMTFSFVLRDKARQWAYRVSDIRAALHGKRARIICDDDPYFYYEGRVRVGTLQADGHTGRLKVTAQVDPYKYEIASSIEPWLWSPFDFRVGVIRQYGFLSPGGWVGEVDGKTYGLLVDGSLTLEVIGGQMPVIPTFYAQSSDGAGLSVTFNGTEYSLFLLDEDENVLEGPGHDVVIVSGDMVYHKATGGIQWPGIDLTEGTYTLTFSGHGHVATEYRGGRL